MAFNINEIRAEMNRTNGFLQTPHFTVNLGAPKWTQGDMDFLKTVPLICCQTILPGMTFTTKDIQMFGYGPSERRPVAPVTGNLEMNFYCDGKAEIFKFFHQWLQAVYNFSDQRVNHKVNGLGTYDFQYPEKYETTMQVYHFDAKAKQVLEYDFYHAWPVQVDDRTVAWELSSEILLFKVTMAYRNWTSNFINTGDSSTESLSYTALRKDQQSSAALSQQLNSSTTSERAKILSNNFPKEVNPRQSRV